MSTSKVDNRTINRKDFVKILRRYSKKVSKNEETAKEFFVELGVLTKKGNLRKNYKDLCIPVEQE